MDDTLRQFLIIWNKIQILTINNGNYIENNIYYGLLVNLDYFMNKVIDYVNSKSVSKYAQKESIHYQQLLNFYNQIDNNRNELKLVDKNFKTLDERNNIYLDKNNKIDKKYKKNNIILLLVIIFNIVGIIVYVKF